MNVQLIESLKLLIQSLPQEERRALRSYLLQEDELLTLPDTDPEQGSKVVDLNEFRGVIQLQQDPLDYQLQLRREWM